MSDSNVQTTVPSNSIRRSRWGCLVPRFSLKTLLVLMTLAAVGIGFYARLERQRTLIQWITRQGGKCQYAHRLSSGRIESWLRQWLPYSYFHPLEKAKLRTQNNDEIVERLHRLNSLICLQMDNSEFENRKLVNLKKLKLLQTLYLHNTSLDDVGLAHISKIPQLKYLRIGRTRITDKGLPHLLSLRKLETLYLNNNQISDKEIHHLAALKSLKCLHLENTSVTPEGIARLKESLPDCLILGP